MIHPSLPFATPLYVMAKAPGSSCNLQCSYCYYLDKGQLYAGVKGTHVMSDDVLETFVRQYIEAQSMPRIMFTWHGGESLLRPISFYRKVIDYQRRYARGVIVDNCIQTNGTLIDDEWCRFFRDNGWLVGVSIDGPEKYHDSFRRDRLGRGSFSRVMKGIEALNRHGVEWNAMAVVNNMNSGDPLGFYHFFKDIDCHYIQFAPIVERIGAAGLASPDDRGAAMAPFSVSPEAWGNFLCAIFDEWVRKDVGDTFVQIFDATLAGWVGVEPGLCTFGKSCGHAAAIEYNGDLYSCDHYVYPDYLLGNIKKQTITEMMLSERQQAFGRTKSTLPRQCRECQWLKLCNGECPKNRFTADAYGENGLNYLCAGYRKYFAHTAGAMAFMRDELQAGRPAAGVMDAEL